MSLRCEGKPGFPGSLSLGPSAMRSGVAAGFIS